MPQFRGGEQLRRLIRAETGKAPFGRVSVEGAGGLAVVKIHTCRPDRVQSGRTDDLISELERALNATVTVEIVPEAHAIAKMVRVPKEMVKNLQERADAHEKAHLILREWVAGTVVRWRREQAEYPAHEAGEAASAAVRLCANELEAALGDGGD